MQYVIFFTIDIFILWQIGFATKKIIHVMIVFEPQSLPQCFWIFCTLHIFSLIFSHGTNIVYQIFAKNLILTRAWNLHHKNSKGDDPQITWKRKKNLVFCFKLYNLSIRIVNFYENLKAYYSKCIVEDVTVEVELQAFFPLISFCTK